MSNEKLVKKVLRMLPKRFAHKVTAIEEAQDLSIMGFDELIENLTTFEMTLEITEPAKGKGVALQASNSENGEENLAETLNMLVKNFNKTLKRFNKKPYFGGSTPAFTARDIQEAMVNPSVNECLADNLSDDEGDLTEEELTANYQLLFIKWSKLTQTYTSGEIERAALKKNNDELLKIVEEQNLEICILKDKVDGMVKGIK
ncbi:hypothetical protein LIER_33534 [Lithospermum erythrorhizon]|uniref:Gag-pol polyprotein n=1 Tax=Lithospermum erythrorhizon TaxID=34254 RepID=A0AAV3RWX9_LITER